MLVHAYTPPPPKPPILMGVMREHFDEGEFLLSRWQQSLDHPSYTFETIASGPERRFVAHVEGLVAGGPMVLEQLLLPWLRPDTPDGFFDPHGARSLAAFVALSTASPGMPERVANTMQALAPDQRSGVLRAFSWWDDPRAPSWIEVMLQRADADAVAGWLAVAAHRRMEITELVLHRALRQGGPAATVAALRALAGNGQPFHLAALESLVTNEDVDVRNAALEAALVRGSRLAWPYVTAQAFDSTVSVAGELVAMLGTPAEQAAMIAWAAQPDAPEHALWCLGLTGRIEAADVAADRLSDARPRIAKLAFEALRAVCGLSADDRRFIDRSWPSSDDEILPEDLSDDPIDALPLPMVYELRAYWKQHRARLTAGRRHLFGEPYTAARVAHALRHGPARRRRALALELAIRSRGTCQIPTRAWTWTQRAAIATAGTLPLDFERGYASVCTEASSC